VVLRLVPLGIPGQFRYHYVEKPCWETLSLLLTAVPAAGIVVVLASARRKGRDLRRRDCVSCLIMFVLCSFLFHVTCSILLNPYGIAGALHHVLQVYGDGSYLMRGTRIDAVSPYLGGLEEELASADIRMFPHPSTHPPGFPLLFYALHKLTDWRVPGVLGFQSWVWQLSPILSEMFQPNPAAHQEFVPYAATACLAAVTFWGAAALLPCVTYPLARLLLDRRDSLLAAGLSALFPGTHLFNPTADQILPGVGTFVIYLGAAAILERRKRLALAFGVAVGIAVNISLAMSVCVAVCSLFALFLEIPAERRRSVNGERQDQLPSAIRLGLWAATGFALVVAALYLVYRMNLLRVLLLCLRNNSCFNQIVGRSYLPCLAVQPFETAYSMGIPVFCLLLWVSVRQAASWNRGPFGPRDAFLLAVVGTLLVLGLSGINRGEVGRLWLFLYPSLAVGVLVGLTKKGHGDSEPMSLDSPFGWSGLPRQFAWTILFVCQTVQTMVLCLLLDPIGSVAGLGGT
jgi:hypothetical protein